MTMGNVISENRKKLELTQEGLAQLLSVTNQAVSKWETDQSMPDTMLLPTLADVLGISVDALFGRMVTATELVPVTQNNGVQLPWENDDAFHAVLFCGHTLIGESKGKEDIHFCYEGPAKDIYSAFSVECGAVQGNVSAGTYVECGDVGGAVCAGTYVECGAVTVDVKAGGYVECGDVGKDVRAGAYVECNQVGGSVGSGTYVECGDVGGDIKAGGYVECGKIGGSANINQKANQFGKEISQTINREVQKKFGKEFNKEMNDFFGELFDDVFHEDSEE